MFLCPRQSGRDVGWGFPDGGPGTLAIILELLLDDITPAPTNRADYDAAKGLLKLTETDWPSGTRFSRTELHAALSSPCALGDRADSRPGPGSARSCGSATAPNTSIRRVRA